MILETGTMRLAGIRWVRRGVRADILVCVRADCQDIDIMAGIDNIGIDN